jgi:hypothetical protein
LTGKVAVACLSLSNRRNAPRLTINSTVPVGAFLVFFFLIAIVRDLIGTPSARI